MPAKARKLKAEHRKARRMPKAVYEKELERLQVRLVDMQHWIVESGARIVVVFEGRDAAGKGGAIKRITQYLNPRNTRVVALPQPSERDKGQWYFQRYIKRMPTSAEIVLFDRSWYNRAGVERVMGYCTDEEYERFLKQAPVVEQLLVDDGIILIKYWFSVSDKEQQRRFAARLDDPMRRWKLSETDLESIIRWEDYSQAKDGMFDATDTPHAPWWTVDSDDKSARLGSTSSITCFRRCRTRRPNHPGSRSPNGPPPVNEARPPVEDQRFVPNHAAELVS